ncbi:MAG: erythromycin esterase family protein [Micromonosporaceae bacterium]
MHLTAGSAELAQGVRQLGRPLVDSADLDDVMRRTGSARIVMLGEASHGTHEFYRWRAELTKRLIAETDVSFVAVEGDWPDAERVDRSVRLAPGAPEDPRAALTAYTRWPTWMWANQEVTDFCRWVRQVNERREPRRRVGFYGLDVYSLWESLEAILLHLREHDPGQMEEALEAYRCFEPYARDPQSYAVTSRFLPEYCESGVIALLAEMRGRVAADGAEEFAASQNAEIVANAERYYRAMMRGGPESWNLRDTHMADTLDRLLAHYGPDSRGVVWAHNTHVGDARATDMTALGEINIGQLARQRYGTADVALVGFGSHSGTVIAADAWGAPATEMRVPPARDGSLEALLHRAAPQNASFVFPPASPPLWLSHPLDHRAIGVVYHPDRERWGNYVPTTLGQRYDAFLWFSQTRALEPLHPLAANTREPETYPTGL